MDHKISTKFNKKLKIRLLKAQNTLTGGGNCLGGGSRGVVMETELFRAERLLATVVNLVGTTGDTIVLATLAANLRQDI